MHAGEEEEFGLQANPGQVHALKRKQLSLYGIIAFEAVVILALAIGIFVVATRRSTFSEEGAVDPTTNQDPNCPGTRPAVPSSTPVIAGDAFVEGVMSHLRALQEIANTHGGSRSISGPGFNASMDYVISQLDSDFYDITTQAFTVPMYTEDITPILSVGGHNLTYKTQFNTLGYEGSGEVMGEMFSVKALGCNVEDYDGFIPGRVALVSRGNCTFRLKAELSEAAGAVAAIFYNEGDSEGRQGLFAGTLGTVAAFPVFAVPWEVGYGWATEINNGGSVPVYIKAHSTLHLYIASNVLATTKEGRVNDTIVVGSHLDSVDAGPGINDNGSGTSAVLQIAIATAAAGVAPVNRLRFAWWGAEEEGLKGSHHYVDTATPQTLSEIALNLNFDMLGSPNYIRGIYNGTSGPTDVAGASYIIQTLFQDVFNEKGLPFELSDFNGRSDYGPFIEEGIPAGGLDTGAEVLKTSEQRAVFGGLANAAYDPCYHQSCDTIDNISPSAMKEMSEAAAAVVHLLARSEDLKMLLHPN